ncbi:MAG: hypothetical protein ACRDDY_03330 [Clostridium sp.]|uniref:hypothetical protein n=1 Tax=Clostridium sp. TaxID=1506 RepID=UPI003EE560F2
MKISELEFALKLFREKNGDLDVCIEKKKNEFNDIQELFTCKFEDSDSETFIVLSDIKL